jgi:hypothetical protein
MPSRTIACASGPNGSRCCGLAVRVVRSVSWSVHSWSETIPFQGASTSCSPKLDRLGQDDLLLRGQAGDPADLAQVEPERVVHPERIGREHLRLLGGRFDKLPSHRCFELVGRRLLALPIVERGESIGGEGAWPGPVLVDCFDRRDRVRGRRGLVGIDTGRQIGRSQGDRARPHRATAERPGAGDLNLGERPRRSA